MNPNENFVVCTNACQQGIGGVLTHNGHVICYEYGNVKEHEQNYVAHDLELAAVVHALKICRHYLIWKKFQLRTDQHGLEYLFEQPNLNAIQRIWMELQCVYDFNIKHIKWKQNEVVDALGRKMHMMHVSMSTGTSDLNDRIKEENNTYEFLQWVKVGLRQWGTSHKFEHYKLEDGILKYKNRVYVPKLENVNKLVLE